MTKNRFKYYYCVWLISIGLQNVKGLYEGDVCIYLGATGTCRGGSKCDVLKKAYENDKITSKDIISCGTNIYEELVCCPNDDIFSVILTTISPTQHSTNLPITPTTTTTTITTLPPVPLEITTSRVYFWWDLSTTTTSTTTPKSTWSTLSPSVIDTTMPTTIKMTTTVTTASASIGSRLSPERPSERACTEYYAGTSPSLTVHVLDGTPVDLGEYPHMAAIGFSQIGGDRNDLVYNCGGTLIHERFVLTAAHCLVKREQIPEMVRLGVTNFLDVEQMAFVVEKRIARTHTHPHYIISRKYNDIALLELESPVELTENVYPTCLYTQEKSPDGELHVSGWGITNTSSRSISNQLLKAPLVLQPLELCNVTYTLGDIPRSIEHGLIESQLCAYDPGHKKDACQGDSGGPLIMDVDISRVQYTVVGIVSAGFDCGTLIPALYTRVYSFLDFIESIVWP